MVWSAQPSQDRPDARAPPPGAGWSTITDVHQSTTRRALPGAVLAVLLVLGAYAASVLALALSRLSGTVPAWWPAAGIGLAAMVLVPRRHRRVLLAALTLAYALGNLTMGRSPVPALALGVLDGVETAVGAWLLDRWLPRHRLERVQDVWRLLLVAVAGAAVAGVGIALVLVVSGADGDGGYLGTLAVVVPAHAASVLLLTPLALVAWPWPRRGRAAGPERALGGPRVELVVQVLALGATTALTFGPHLALTAGFLPLPLLVWGAVRFASWVVAAEQAAFAVAVTVLTSVGWGPFDLEERLDGLVSGDPVSGTQLAQLYLLCVVLVGLPLATAMGERARALARATAAEDVFRRNFTGSRTATALVSWDGTSAWLEGLNDAARELLPPTGERPRLDVVLGAEELLGALGDAATGPLGGWSGPLVVRGRAGSALHGILSLVQHTDGRSEYLLHLTDVAGPLQLQQALRAERRYARAVIDTASSLILVTDEVGTVLAANPATTALTGWTEEDLLGRPFWDVLLPERVRAGIQRQFSDPATVPGHGESVLLARDGTTRTVVFSNSVHRDTPDSPAYLVLTAIDVTAAREDAEMVAHVLRSVTTTALVGTDLEGRVTVVNPGAEQVLGLDAEEVRGRLLTDLVEAAPPTPTVEEATRLPATAHAVSLEDLLHEARGPRDWLLRPPGRPPVRVSMSGDTVTRSSGAAFAHLFVARDVTETRRHQEILVDALRREREVVARLQDLDRAKDDFVSTVSHELRTPMSSIIGSSEMLADGILGELLPEQQRMVEVIVRNSDRLLTLADDLLVLATSDQRPWPDQTRAVDLREVVRESGESVQAILAGRALAVSFEVPDEEVQVRGEPSHLERAVSNLLTNAVKFTPDGGRVEVRLTRDEEHRRAVVEVADTGLGIDPEDLEAVFGRFYRSRVVQDRAIQGSGLGLSIVRTIVEHHEGTVSVTSTPGRGSTFTLTLPLVRPPRAAVEPGEGRSGGRPER